MIAEYSATSWGGTYTWAKSYVHAGSRLLSTYTSNGAGGETLEFHHPDRLGTRMVTNPSADTLYLQSTLPFGTAFASETTGSSNRLFTSYDRSPSTGLDYAVNRTYSPGQGRFTTVDPIGMASVSFGNPQSLNLYAYVSNQPADLVDPSGLDDEACSASGKIGEDGQPIYDGTIGADGKCHSHAGEPVVIHGWFDLPFNFGGPEFFVLETPIFDLGSIIEQQPINDPNEPGDGVAKSVNFVNSFCSITSSAAQHNSASNGYWRGVNGERYSTSWGGNQYTGSRSSALARSNAFRVAGKFLFFTGVAITAYQVSTGEVSIGKGISDTAFSAVGTFGGVAGFVVGGGYFLVDSTVGWSRVGSTLAYTPAERRNNCARQMLTNKLGPPR